jgi:transcriptional regulator with GAF, ATPase, and Fis domain
VLFSDGKIIGEEDLPRALRQPAPIARQGESLPFAKAVEEFEKKLLADTIASAGGIKAEAARRLGLDANQIKYLCRKYGL